MDNKIYRFSELKEKYQWGCNPTTADRMIEYAKNCGVILQRIDKPIKPISFKIIDSSIADYEWKVCPIFTSFEVCKEGLIRNKHTKKIWNTKSMEGYVIARDPKMRNNTCSAHRMIMETFNPILNSQDFIVDHINGKKDDNRLENLRWVSSKGNNMYRFENWDKLSQPFKELLDLVGYEQMIDILNTQIKNYKQKN